MALHRLNVLHLHLTDDQGWRVEIKGYPRLTEVGAWREQTLIGSTEAPEETWTFDGTPTAASTPRRNSRAWSSTHGAAAS